jgi:hypothetical protein
LALVVVLVLLLPTVASADFNTKQWELTGCPYDSTLRNAPLNVVFYHSTSSAALTFFTSNVDWSSTDATSRRYQSHDDCGLIDWKRASASISSLSVGSSRYLIETRHTLHSDLKYGSTATAGVRRQTRTATCLRVSPATSSISSGYDRGRSALYSELIGAASAFSAPYWGNTATIHQCDGTNAGSNGYVYWFRVP